MISECNSNIVGKETLKNQSKLGMGTTNKYSENHCKIKVRIFARILKLSEAIVANFIALEEWSALKLVPSPMKKFMMVRRRNKEVICRQFAQRSSTK